MKTLLLVTIRCGLGLALGAALATSAHATVTNVAWYRLGENDPGAANGLAVTNTTTDLVGVNHLKQFGSPRYTNAVSTGAANQVGSSLALHFNGTSQYLSNAVVSPAVNNFGIEAWVKPNTTNAGFGFIAFNGFGAGGWGMYQSGGGYVALFGGVGEISGGTASPETWAHLALVRDNGTATFYVNGIAIGTTTLTPNAVVGGFGLGAYVQGSANTFFNGAIDEVRVFTFGSNQFCVGDLLINLSPPAVQTLAATGATYTNATTLNGSASLLATSAWFEWGTTTNYGNVTSAQVLGSGSGQTNFNQALTGLSGVVTYHYRAVASNCRGVVYGDDQSFTGAKTIYYPGLPCSECCPIPNVTASPQRCINTQLADGDTLVLQANTYVIPTLLITNGVTIRGEMFGDTDTRPHVTIRPTSGRVFEINAPGKIVKLANLIIEQGNSGSSSGGGVRVQANTSLIVDNCIIRDNTASGNSGGGIRGFPGSTITIMNSVIYGNSATNTLSGFGGGGISAGGKLFMTNCTISGNIGWPGGGGIACTSNAILDRCTIVSNTAGFGGGFLGTTNAGAGLQLANTILAGNSDRDFEGRLDSGGYNLIQDISPTNVLLQLTSSDILGLPANLGPLGYTYSFPPFVVTGHIPQLGSPVINRGDPLITTGTDGFGQPRRRGPAMDIGAFEVQDPDGDVDGMPDEWEMQFGLNPFNPADANGDLDADGLSNLNEYLAGTAPTNAASVFRIVSAKGLGTPQLPREFSFNSVTGRLYTLQFKDPGAILLNTWQDAPSQVDVPGSGSLQQLRHTNTAAMLYRLRLRKP